MRPPRAPSVDRERTGETAEQGGVAEGSGSSAIQDRKAHLVEVSRIGDRFDLGNLASPDREAQKEHQTSTRGHHDSLVIRTTSETGLM
jgi:hypothetical protein